MLSSHSAGRTPTARMSAQHTTPYHSGPSCEACQLDPTLRHKAHTHSTANCGHVKRAQSQPLRQASQQIPLSSDQFVNWQNHFNTMTANMSRAGVPLSGFPPYPALTWGNPSPVTTMPSSSTDVAITQKALTLPSIDPMQWSATPGLTLTTPQDTFDSIYNSLQ